MYSVLSELLHECMLCVVLLNSLHIWQSGAALQCGFFASLSTRTFGQLLILDVRWLEWYV